MSIIDSSFSPISSAPRDGRIIEVAAEDGGIYRMRWDAKRKSGFALPTDKPGCWVDPNNNFIWSEGRPGIGPTHWRHCLVRRLHTNAAE